MARTAWTCAMTLYSSLVQPGYVRFHCTAPWYSLDMCDDIVKLLGTAWIYVRWHCTAPLYSLDMCDDSVQLFGTAWICAMILYSSLVQPGYVR